MTTTRRVFKKLLNEAVVLPLRLDRARSAIRLYALWGLQGARRLGGATLAVLVICGILAWQGYLMLAALLAGLVAILLVARLAHVVELPIAVALLSLRSFTPTAVPSGRQTLEELGLDAVVIERLMAEAGGGEVILAQFDQENRVLSRIGDIPFFRQALISEAQFVPRIRHRLELVLKSGVVAVKKAYRDRASFRYEALALATLWAVDGVPKIVGLRSRERILYQSFIPGQNLGSLMTGRGVGVAVQHQVSVEYPGVEQWDDDRAPAVRGEAVQAVSDLVGPEVIRELGRLVERIHQSGVAIRDLKYGNVLLWRGAPYLCDFDLARVYRRSGMRFLQERLADRDRFNYVFGGNLMTPARFHRDMAAVAAATPGGQYAPVYFGWGYQYLSVGNAEFGTGKWRLLRRHLPDLTGKRILDLGSNNAFLPLEMLRAGARKVTAYEYGPVNAQMGRLNHQMFEFVDNRTYDLEIVVAYMHELCERDWSGYDLVTAFCSLYYEPPPLMERIVQTVSRAGVPCMIVQCNENTDEHSGEQLRWASLSYQQDLLARNGYPYQRVVRYPAHHRPMIIGCARRVERGRMVVAERRAGERVEPGVT